MVVQTTCFKIACQVHAAHPSRGGIDRQGMAVTFNASEAEAEHPETDEVCCACICTLCKGCPAHLIFLPLGSYAVPLVALYPSLKSRRRPPAFPMLHVEVLCLLTHVACCPQASAGTPTASTPRPANTKELLQYVLRNYIKLYNKVCGQDWSEWGNMFVGQDHGNGRGQPPLPPSPPLTVFISQRYKRRSR